jgi:hypothetical protein
MCCLLSVLFLLGPRAAIFFWWLADPYRWSHAFNTFAIPLLGFIFLPWTTLMYVLVAPHGIVGADWFFLAIALLADIAGYAGTGYGNRRRMPGYAG